MVTYGKSEKKKDKKSTTGKFHGKCTLYCPFRVMNTYKGMFKTFFYRKRSLFLLKIIPTGTRKSPWLTEKLMINNHWYKSNYGKYIRGHIVPKKTLFA